MASNQGADKQRTEIGEVLHRFRRAFYGIGAFSFVINLLALAPALYMLQVYDRVLASRNETTLLMLSLLVVAIYGLQSLLRYMRSSVLVRIGNRFDMTLNKRVFTAAFERKLHNHDGDPSQAIQDMGKIRTFLSGNALGALFDVPWTPIYIAVAYIIHPMLGSIMVFGAVVLFLLAWLTNAATAKPLEESSQAGNSASNFANSHLHNAEAIEAMGMLSGMRERWFTQHKNMLGQQALASDRSERINGVSRFIRTSLQSLILGAGALLVLDNQITPGMMIMCSILLGQALRPVEQVIGSWQQAVACRGAYSRLNRLLESAPPRQTSLSLPAPQGRLVLENVFAAPPGRSEVVISSVSFTVEAGDTVGLIGPTGAGKSTLARLLVGVWGARIGTVRLDGADIYRWNKDELGPYVGYLPQDIELFDGTVAENIARFTEPDSDKVIKAAQQAGVHDMILHLPKGYETRLGNDGSALSGGQRQRVALARALYGDPTLIVLDEPNSNLDDAGEAALVETIKALRERGATVVIASHRANVLNAVNKLLVMRNGGLALYGDQGEVVEKLQQQKAKAVGHDEG